MILRKELDFFIIFYLNKIFIYNKDLGQVYVNII